MNLASKGCISADSSSHRVYMCRIMGSWKMSVYISVIIVIISVSCAYGFDCYYCSTSHDTGVNNPGLDGDCGNNNFNSEFIDKHRNCIGVCVVNETIVTISQELVAVDRFCTTRCPNKGECETNGQHQSCYDCCQGDFCNAATTIFPMFLPYVFWYLLASMLIWIS
ncbi:uncharacterized protein LOC144363595 [Saccoglossus kowalevskii]